MDNKKWCWTLSQSLMFGSHVYTLSEAFHSNRRHNKKYNPNEDRYIWLMFFPIYVQSHGCVTVCFRCWTNGVWSWPWFQLSSLVLFRSFCGLGLLSYSYPGSPYPKKHLQGTRTSRKICIKFPLDTYAQFIYREALFSQFVHQLGVSVYNCEIVYLTFRFNTNSVCVV